MVSYFLAKNLAQLAIIQDNYIAFLEGRHHQIGPKIGEEFKAKIDYYKNLVDWKGNYANKT